MAKRGRKSYEASDRDRGRVQAMVGFGVRQDLIAREIGCDPTTLRKYFREELDMGRMRANVTVAGCLFRNCQDGNVAAQIFWLKTQAGWKETETEINISGSINQNVQLIKRVIVDPSD
jgi:hypothetical protein